jgi:hypothetical protein
VLWHWYVRFCKSGGGSGPGPGVVGGLAPHVLLQSAVLYLPLELGRHNFEEGSHLNVWLPGGDGGGDGGPGPGGDGPGGPGGGDGVHPKAPVQEAQQSFKLLNGPGGSPGKVISQSFPIPATLAHLYVLSPAAERPPGVVAPLGPTRGKERGAKWCRGEGIATCPGSGGIEFAGRSGGRSGGGAGGACSPSDAAADSATDEAATRSTARDVAAPVAARARMPAMSRASGTVLGWPHTRVDAAPRATQAGAGAGADDVPMLMVCTAPRGAGAPRGRE